ncbi:H+ translocating pyrophosphate synthase [Fimbriimonas ginsengisoli Gsoil 348]|uniref:K(+)-insensitive pyrophosphate-energized proton pump n=1 Tax=Fimbriimonas ginsengisoli Gsoil 348 TaxID=661478 RepID=A0A068NZ33_FIMGI|nr:H+ translocating pyrophosphate synthase [Fimbriimonas ginsengisoli Gsoil 348]
MFLAAIGALLPTSAFAAEGEGVSLKFSGSDSGLLIAALVLGLIAVGAALFLRSWVLKQNPGSSEMQEVGLAIRDGATAYLKKQIGTMIPFVVLLALGLFGLSYPSGILPAIGVAVAFVFGVIGSYTAGSTGMMIAVSANMRTAHAALSSYKRSLETAFRSGAVAGLLTVGIGLVGACIILLIGGSNAIQYLVGFGFGGSLAALFMRVGGGIFTKAADVGADLVGKVEKGIPEDDPRNPAVIADNVGDNVGDCAGMAADVFESYLVTIISAIVLAAATSSVLDTHTWMKLVLFTMIVSALGILASVIGIFTVRGNDNLDSDPLVAIRKGFTRSALLAGLGAAVVAFFFMGGRQPLLTDRLSPLQDSLRTDATFLQKVREEVATRKPSQAAVDAAVQEKAKEFAKQPKDIKASDIFADPAKIPTSVQGFSQASVDRILQKSANPVAPSEVTAADLVNVAEVKAKGYRPEDAGYVQQALMAQLDQMPPSKPLTGFQRITDFKDTSIKALDYGITAQATDPANPPKKPYVAIRDYFGGEGDNRFVVAQLHAKVHIPPRPAQGGQPASIEQNTDQTIWQGPIKLSDLNDKIKKFQEQTKTQGITSDIQVVKTEDVGVYVNPSTGDLAIGLPGTMDHPASRQSAQSQFAYYKKPAAELNADYEKLTANPQGPQPVLPQRMEMQLAVNTQGAIPWWNFFIPVLVGILLAFGIERLTEFYVSTHKRPVQEVAGVSSGGAAPMIIQGFAYASESSAMMVFAIVAALMVPLFVFPATVYGGYVLALYGVSLVGIGLLSTTGYVLAMDTFGPISDNAQGVFEMSGAGKANPQAAKAIGHLDAAGNTTKALTKGFAIATAVVAAIALFNSFRGAAMLTDIGLKLDTPEIFLGMLIGGAAPFLFSSFAINAVGRAAFQLINEVRRQFRENPGIMAGTVKPDYARCVALVTAAAQKELLAPGILAIALPTAVAFGFSIGKPTTIVNGVEYNLMGAQALGGFLAGTILSGQLMAVLLSNSGGMWDNAKKLIEDGLYGGKGSEAHKASVICDTVGDPFKDTAGPALNPLIKVMNLVALLLAATIIRPFGTPVLVTVTVVCVGALVFSIYLSKKGSLSEDLQRAQKEGANADAHLTHPPTLETGTSTTIEPPRQKRRITVEDTDDEA